MMGLNKFSVMFNKHKGFKIFLIVLLAIILISVLIKLTLAKSGSNIIGKDEKISIAHDYIGQLNISGTISETESDSVLSSSTYHHRWLLDRIADMKDDKRNKGLMLIVDTPGGSVYASDELYLAIKDYQKKTRRPVYSYMATQATSGGYYISAPCDRIMINRNCWTGSIGVTMGTMYNIKDFLNKMGVKTVTITSGRNKAMGNMTDDMTGEQKKILQSLVDEAYDQFVGIVAEGRKLSRSKVRKIADGRIYSAKQAKNHKLVDEIATLGEARSDMKDRYSLGNAEFEEFEYDDKKGFLSELLGESVSKMIKSKLTGEKSKLTEIEQLKSLMSENQSFTVTYMAPVRH